MLIVGRGVSTAGESESLMRRFRRIIQAQKRVDHSKALTVWCKCSSLPSGTKIVPELDSMDMPQLY